MESINDTGNNMTVNKTRQRGLLKYHKGNINFFSGV